MEAKRDFEDQLARLDTGLYDAIEAQLTDEDKRSLLAIQKAVRRAYPEYCFLEIGSHLGGSIQPFLLDPQCHAIISIDKRPTWMPDERDVNPQFPGNSTARMIENLQRLSAVNVGKLQTFDSEAHAVAPASLRARPALCFIDAQHTDQAVESDFDFCFSVVEAVGAICFHDSNVVFTGISRIIARLQESGVRFVAYNLPSFVFVIELGDIALHQSPDIMRMLINNHEAYLPALTSMKHYRSFYNSFPVRVLRDVTRPMRKLAARLKRRTH